MRSFGRALSIVALLACSSCSRADTHRAAPAMEALPPVEGTWARSGDLLEARGNHAVVAMPDGGALVLGGATSGERLATVERFEPSTNKWQKRAPMPGPVQDLRAVVLRDGRVLACGGAADATTFLDRCALYDSAKDEWRSGAKMPWPRVDHELVMLADGSVLAVGGRNQLLAVAAESAVYDPARDAWTPAGSLSVARMGHTATLLRDGRVAVIGGTGVSSHTRTASIELFDPVKRAWTSAASLASPRSDHLVVPRADGTIVVFAGKTEVPSGESPVQKTFEIFDPKSGKTSAGPAAHRRTGGDGVPLADGRVFLLQSVDENIKDAPPLVIDAAKNGSAPAPAFPRQRGVLSERVAVALKDGRVLAAGSSLQSGGVSAETWVLSFK